VLQRLAVQRVQHRVPGPVRRARAAVRLPASAVIEALASERALIDFPVVGSRERQAVVFELDHRLGRLAAHVLDRVLVPEPVRALDRVVRVPAPVVLGHVPERGVDAALRGDRVRARREQLGDARRLQAMLAEADRGAQTGTAGADDDGVVLVVDDLVSGLVGACCGRNRSREEEEARQSLDDLNLNIRHRKRGQERGRK